MPSEIFYVILGMAVGLPLGMMLGIAAVRLGWIRAGDVRQKGY